MIGKWLRTLRARTPSEPQKSAIAGGEVLFLDGEDLADLHLEVANETNSPGRILQPCVISPGADAGDSQSFVGIDGPILVILALVIAPIRCSGRRKIEFRKGVQRQIPKARRPFG